LVVTSLCLYEEVLVTLIMSLKRNRGVMTSQCNKELLSFALSTVTFLGKIMLKVKLTLLLIKHNVKIGVLSGGETSASPSGRYISGTNSIGNGVA
jgi:hypothetical protein